MQTFLPYADFTQSVSCLDPKRLVKQVTEGNQILQTLTEGSRYEHHPAVLQWKGYGRELGRYIQECLSRVEALGYRTAKGRANLTRFVAQVSEQTDIPPWLGNPEYHRTHRSRLLFKGRCDSTCIQLKLFLRVRSINTWLKAQGYPEKAMLEYADLLHLEQYCRERFTLKVTNYYHQFNWSEPDNLEYFWPTRQK